jgi:sarcosine oxidase, subunit beta
LGVEATLKRTADVVIIGGGCMGASTAFHLAQNGVTDVVLLEREQFLGTGSTGRNAGGFRHQFSNEANIRLSLESIRFLKEFEQRVGYEIDFHQDGYLFLISTASAFESFKRNVDLQKSFGIPVEIVMANEITRLAPGLDTEGLIAGTFCPEDGIADPNGVTQGFARAAVSKGVAIHRGTEVTGIHLEGGRVRGVATSKGDISARIVINAAGPYARDIGRMAGVDIPVLPYRRHIFITEPVRHASSDFGITSRLMVIDFETTFYFHREGAGILFGMSDPGEPPGHNITVSWEFLESVTQVAKRRLPVLMDLGIAHAWAGLYEMTPDAMPIIGPVESVEGFFQINGFSGHGFQHSPAAGRILADIIVGNDVGEIDLAPFSFERFDKGEISGEANVI